MGLKTGWSYCPCYRPPTTGWGSSFERHEGVPPRISLPDTLARSLIAGQQRRMVEPGTILTGISTTASVLKILDSLIKRTRGRKRALLIELRSNIQLIDLYTEGDLPIDKVVARLETSHIRTALESNFNFNSLKRGKLKRSTTGNVPQFRRYAGWTTERLFSNIYLKIKGLQTIIEIDPDNERFRKSVRLINIRKLMLLLLKHIQS